MAASLRAATCMSLCARELLMSAPSARRRDLIDPERATVRLLCSLLANRSELSCSGGTFAFVPC